MTTPETDLGFPTKGSLKRVSFSSLLRAIAGAATSGSLYLMSGDTKKVVFFVDGRPTLVRSNLATEFLGQILTDQGLITQEQCDNTLEAIRRTGKKQGELLVEMGILSEHNLQYGLEEQLRLKLFEIFGWDDGRFQFKPGTEPGVSTTPHAGTTEALILAAIQERVSDERAREALRPWADNYPTQSPKWSGDPATLELLPEELYFLRCIDGSRTTDELLSRRHDLEVPRVATLLLGLLHAGVIEPQAIKSPRRLAPLRPNLGPPATADEQLAPNYEVASTIGEYEDTPLPSRLPTDLGASSSKNPRIPILPTEDEEMFRGLNRDESIIVAAPRSLRLKPMKPAPEPVPEPAPVSAPVSAAEPAGALDEETDFSDIQAAAPEPEPVVAAPRPDSGSHPLAATPDLAAPPEDDEAAISHTAAVLSLLDDPELPDDLPDDLPDPDELLGDEPFDEIEELEDLDDEIIEDEDEPPAEVAAAPEDAAEAEDPLAALAGLDLAGFAGDRDAEPPLSAPALSLPPEDALLEDDLPEEPASLGDLGELGDPGESLTAAVIEGGLGDLGDLGDPGESLTAAVIEGDLGVFGDLGDLGDPGESMTAAVIESDDGDDDLLADIDDDLLITSDGDEALPDLDDLDALDLGDDLEGDGEGELAADLGAEPGGELGGDLDGELEVDEEFDPLEDEEPELADIGEEDGYADEPLLGSAESTYVGPSDDAGSADAGAGNYGLVRFSEAEAAMREGDYDTAVALFEDAYNTGYDSAHLHGHLAFARYRASGGAPDVGQNSLELLDYAEAMDPGLAILAAYRGAILIGLGHTDSARECFDRALYLDPYCELALEYREPD